MSSLSAAVLPVWGRPWVPARPGREHPDCGPGSGAGRHSAQCIHNGFGLQHFKAELTGPEYAQRVLEQVIETEIDVTTDSYVVDIAPDHSSDSGKNAFATFARNSSTVKPRNPGKQQVKLISASQGVKVISATAVVLAMGARERTRGAIRTPGSRPAGVMTAGLAQRFVNLMGLLLPGNERSFSAPATLA
jgi:hypothetical protein